MLPGGSLAYLNEQWPLDIQERLPLILNLLRTFVSKLSKKTPQFDISLA